MKVCYVLGSVQRCPNSHAHTTRLHASFAKKKKQRPAFRLPTAPRTLLVSCITLRLYFLVFSCSFFPFLFKVLSFLSRRVCVCSSVLLSSLRHAITFDISTLLHFESRKTRFAVLLGRADC